MRLVYLDEAGTASAANWVAVAGVIVRGDAQWREADRRITLVLDKYIPEGHRAGFIFHATDVFHGSRYFDRRQPQWATREQRWPILTDLADIIADLRLPVVVGTEDKNPFSFEPTRPSDRLHMWSALNCLYWTDLWLTAFAPDELSVIVHEDGALAKPLIKDLVRACRHPDLLPDFGSLSLEDAYGLPFEHIIDTVHFVEKEDARLLQLADLCAFMIGRAVQGRQTLEGVMHVIDEGTAWARQLRPTPFPAVAGFED